MVSHKKNRDFPLNNVKGITLLDTPKGKVEIRPYCDAKMISGLEYDPGIGVFPHYKSIFSDIEGLIKASRKDGSKVTLATNNGKIVGYTVCQFPEKGEFWAKFGDKLMYEFSAIEIGRGWRHMGLARPLIAATMNDDRLEDLIVYGVGLSWHWDLEDGKYTVQEYRKRMMNLLRDFGFKPYHTSEPNVCLRPENFFMARIGSRVPEDIKKRFSLMLFGIFE